MRLGTKTRYASRAMLELAEHYGLRRVSSREIAEQQGVSVKYLEQLLGVLRSASLIRSVRGAQGGHSLARPPEEINLREIYESIEGHDGLVPCHGDPEACERFGLCATQEVWVRMYQASMEVLSSTTLADLVLRSHELGAVSSCVDDLPAGIVASLGDGSSTA